MGKSFKDEFGDALEQAYPGQVLRNVSIRIEKDKGKKGHNANATDDRLKLLIERIERLEEEKKGISDDIRDVFLEAKAVGYDPKIMKKVIALRKMKPDDRSEMQMVLETYANALGMQMVLL